MTMDDVDGVYRSRRRRAQRRKKLAVGVAGLAAMLAGGGYAVSAWQTARESTIIGDTGALGPVATPGTAEPTDTGTGAGASPSPSAGVSRPSAPRLSAARRSSRPSPTPSPSTLLDGDLADGDLAGAQVNRLLPGSPGGAVAAGGSTVVANETGADGSAIRIVSGLHDLRERLMAADEGVQVGDARCTQNLQTDGTAAEVRPKMLLCWRVSAGKSVVTVATHTAGKPLTAASVRVIDRVWRQLG